MYAVGTGLVQTEPRADDVDKSAIEALEHGDETLTPAWRAYAGWILVGVFLVLVLRQNSRYLESYRFEFVSSFQLSQLQHLARQEAQRQLLNISTECVEREGEPAVISVDQVCSPVHKD